MERASAANGGPANASIAKAQAAKQAIAKAGPAKSSKARSAPSAKRTAPVTRAANPNHGQRIGIVKVEVFSVKGATTGERKKGRKTGTKRNAKGGRPARKHDIDWLVDYMARIDVKDYVVGPDGKPVPVIFADVGHFAAEDKLKAWANEHIAAVKKEKIQPAWDPAKAPKPAERRMNQTTATVACLMISHPDKYDPLDQGQRNWDEDVREFAKKLYGKYLLAMIGHLDSGHWHWNIIVGDPDQLVPVNQLALADAHTPRIVRAEGAKLSRPKAPLPKIAKRDSIAVGGKRLLDEYHQEVGRKHGLERKGREQFRRDTDPIFQKVRRQVRQEIAEVDEALLERQRELDAQQRKAAALVEEFEGKVKVADAQRQELAVHLDAVKGEREELKRKTIEAEAAKAEAEDDKRTFTQALADIGAFLREELGVTKAADFVRRLRDFVLRRDPSAGPAGVASGGLPPAGPGRQL